MDLGRVICRLYLGYMWLGTYNPRLALCLWGFEACWVIWLHVVANSHIHTLDSVYHQSYGMPTGSVIV